jgi:hydrogenase nickel insertion protein HypA
MLMHEGSVTKSIIDTVIDINTSKNITGKIKKINITVGVCQGLVPESMIMFFDMEKPGTILENTELRVNVQNIVAECPVCNNTHILEIPVMYCPDCGGVMKMVKGNEIIIDNLEVEE